MKIVNLTRRSIRLHDTSGKAVDLPADPRHVGLASVTDHQQLDDGNGHRFSVTVQRVREVKGMPEREDGTVFVVPVDVAMSLQGTRDDVVFISEDAEIPDGAHPMRISHLRRLIPPSRDGVGGS